LFNNGELPENMVEGTDHEEDFQLDGIEDLDDSDGSDAKPKKQSDKKKPQKKKTSQYYRLKPPPKFINQINNVPILSE